MDKNKLKNSEEENKKLKKEKDDLQKLYNHLSVNLQVYFVIVALMIIH